MAKKLFLTFFIISFTICEDKMNLSNEISKETKVIESSVKAGEIYQHYSGKKYKIISLAHHSENPEEILVIYEGLYDCPAFGKNPVWARPLKMFIENVTINQKEQPRFKKLNSAD